MKRVLLAVLCIALALAGAFYFLSLAPTGVQAQRQAARRSPAVSLRDLENADAAALTLNGKLVKVADLIEEGRPVLINFWATWCPPCREETPHLIQLAQQYPGLTILSFNTEDPAEKLLTVRQFALTAGVNFPVYFAPAGLCAVLNGGEQCHSIPQTFVFGRNGKLTGKLVGYSQASLNAAVARALQSSRAGRVEPEAEEEEETERPAPSASKSSFQVFHVPDKSAPANPPPVKPAKNEAKTAPPVKRRNK